MRLSVAIMAHPSRRELVGDLVTRLDAAVVIAWDRANDRWETGRRAMLAYEPAADYHVVIQDDVIPCRNLLAGLSRALDHVAVGAPLSGYLGLYRPPIHQIGDAPARADAVGASFITLQTLSFGPLVAVPTEAIKEMVAYGDTLTDVANYDRRLSRYWQLERGMRVWYTWPSLVDHRVSPSLIPGRACATDQNPGGRVAHRFLGSECSALGLDWTGPVIHAGEDE